MNVFVLAILIYLLYRFIGGFLIPLFRTTKNMRQQFHNMNNQGTPNAQGPTPNDPEPPPHANSTHSKVGEYIDFEEVK
jgi:hypothetical protein